MNILKSILCLLAITSLAACQVEAEQAEQTETEQADTTHSDYVDNLIQVGTVSLELSDELLTELQNQPTINDQFMVLYDNFEPVLDRSDSLTGPDSNDNGIRDDIEAFIDALQVEEPVRKAIKQNARYQQSVMSYDFSDTTNESRAYDLARSSLRASACIEYRKINLDDEIEISKTILAFTYNTKGRTLQYFEYNHLLSGGAFKLLDAKEEYCE